MSNRLISEDDVALLSANPNVEYVSSRCITFTPEFKQKAYDLLHSGIGMREILLKHGVDPAQLGNTRVRGLREKIEIASKRPEGFANLRKARSTQPVADPEATLQKQLRELRQELAYTRQEVEFLKKIRMADMEARREWESQHRQK